MTIRAVLFDMGGTLETFWHTPEMRLRATPGIRQKLLEAGIDLPISDMDLYEVINSGWERYHKQSIATMQELPPARVWREFIFARYTMDAKKLSSVAEELMVALELNYFQRQMRPEVPGVLEEIRRSGYKLGLISNVCSQGQVIHSLKTYGLLEYFDPLVLSSRYGRRKPDPAIFHYAARLANVPTSECLYIGDRIARDVLGARRAGYGYAVQIINEFDHGEKDEGAEPDVRIHLMTELLDFLRSESKQDGARPERYKEIRALLFDAGDILYSRPVRDHKLLEFIREAGLAESRVDEAAVRGLRQQAYYGSITQEEYREAVLRLYGVSDHGQMARGKRAMKDDDANIRFFPGVRETLLALKEHGFLLGIITDTANPLHDKLKWFEDGGFGHVWDSIISSQEVGIQKPAPGIYEAALQQLGVSASRAVFIGHDADELDGARAVGMKTIAFNHAKNTRADFYVERFPDLLDVPGISTEQSSLTGG